MSIYLKIVEVYKMKSKEMLKKYIEALEEQNKLLKESEKEQEKDEEKKVESESPKKEEEVLEDKKETKKESEDENENEDEDDEKIEKLLQEKRKNNSGITINDKFKIQIFFGNIEESKKNLMAFKKDFPNLDGTIVFSNPSYKVWIGSFKTKIEADKFLIQVKKKFLSAVIIEPNKK
jgi:hypothetical protein